MDEQPNTTEESQPRDVPRVKDQLLALATLFQINAESYDRALANELTPSMRWVVVGASWAARIDAERARARATRTGGPLDVNQALLAHRSLLNHVYLSALSNGQGQLPPDVFLTEDEVEWEDTDNDLLALAQLCDLSADNAHRIARAAPPRTVYLVFLGMCREHRMNAMRTREVHTPTTNREPPNPARLMDMLEGFRQIGTAFSSEKEPEPELEPGPELESE
jgi:hypothetical protein